jgi:polyhydroxybutyrate depolymerase
MRRGEQGTRPGHRPAGWFLLLTVLTAVTVAAGSCATGRVAAPAKVAADVEPSSGCDRPEPVGAVAAGEEWSRSLHAGAVDGSYGLSVPRTYRSRRPTPLILLFSGFDSDPAQFSALTHLPARGSADGYLVAVPHTKSGESEWQFSGHGTDASFVDTLVGSLERSYCVDRRAIFAAGFSAGAAFTISYSCAHQHQIAAIATVAVEFQLGCTRPMSILAFHGTDDPLVPYDNGAVGLSLPGVKVRGTLLNMGDWARLDHCRTPPRLAPVGSQVIRRQWSRCADGTTVVLYTVLGGGHAWPGADPAKAVGLTAEQVSATTQMLSFFSRRTDGVVTQ